MFLWVDEFLGCKAWVFHLFLPLQPKMSSKTLFLGEPFSPEATFWGEFQEEGEKRKLHRQKSIQPQTLFMGSKAWFWDQLNHRLTELEGTSNSPHNAGKFSTTSFIHPQEPMLHAQKMKINFYQFSLPAADPQFAPTGIPEGPLPLRSSISRHSVGCYSTDWNAFH